MNIVQLQETLVGAQKEFINQIEEAINRLEAEMKEASEVESAGHPEWERSIGGYIDELHRVIFSLAEPRYGSEEDHKKIAALRKRLKDLYAEFKNMAKK